MSITAAPPTTHPMIFACAEVRAAAATVNGPGQACLWQLTGTEKLAVVEESLRARSSWDAAVAQMIGELERDQVCMSECGVRTTAWLRSTRMMTLGTARREVRTGAALVGRFAATAAAMASGEISHEQAQAVVRTLDELPPDFSSEQVKAGEATLLEFARQFDPKGIDRCASALINAIAPEIAELKDAQRLEKQEIAAQRTKFLRFGSDGHGSMYFSGKAPIADGEAFRTLIEALAKADRTGADLNNGSGDMRTADQRRLDALMDIIRRYTTSGDGPANGGDRPRVNLLLDLKTLVGGLKPAVLLESGEQISAEQARVLACDADILPLVCNGASQPLDVGRQQRMFTGALRSALAARDRGCAFPACDRPPRDCDGHHLVPWWEGGETSLANGALLCRYHHNQVEPKNRTFIQEHHQWSMRMALDGWPEAIPPAYVDGDRRPQRHERFPQRA
jgi:hypothetical protein